MNLDRYKHHKKLQEKSTQYYYFSDAINNAMNSDSEILKYVQEWIRLNNPDIDSQLPMNSQIERLSQEDILTLELDLHSNFEITENKKPNKNQTKVPIHALVLIDNWGTDDEPRKTMWNKSKGEVIAVNKDGTYKIKITDIKKSDVQFSKKNYAKADKGLRQKLNLPRSAFKTLREIENAEREEKEKTKAKKSESIRKTARRLM